MPLVTSLGHGVLLKYPFPARCTNELTVHGALLFSRSTTTVPWLVTMVAWLFAEESGVAGGLPTFRAAGGFGVYVQCEAGGVAGAPLGTVASGVAGGRATVDGVGDALVLGFDVAEAAGLDELTPNRK